jgi:hypothetical protein
MRRSFYFGVFLTFVFLFVFRLPQYRLISYEQMDEEERQRVEVVLKNAAEAKTNWYAAAGEFCGNSELFCEDFEGVDTAWDGSTGTYDCNLDTADDWCDDDVGNGYGGSEALSFYGWNVSSNVYEGITSSDEFYVELWMKVDTLESWYTFGPRLETAAAAVEVAQLNINDQSPAGFNISVNDSGDSTAFTSGLLSVDTWTHVGWYYNESSGQIRIWVNTDGDSFYNGDCVLEETVTTGSDNAVIVRMWGTGGSGTGLFNYDNVKVISGAPPWDTVSCP